MIMLVMWVLRRAHGMQVCVVAHSWGDTVFRHFMSWVSADNPLWVEQHVAVYANIAGPTLGVPKAVSSFLSGRQAVAFQSSIKLLPKKDGKRTG